MKNIMHGYIRVNDVFNKLCGYLVALMMAVMTGLIFWQVIARYVLGSSLAWSEELSRFLMIYVVLIGASLALRNGRLLAVEVVPEMLNEKIRKWIVILTHLISMIFYVILIVYGLDLAQKFSNQIAPGTGISMFIIYLSLPIGGILFFLNSITCIFEEFIGRKE
ncbi:TRAP transporter [Domibacillus aminovorans]|uniref:TRAP transporter n=1 Tax=Domibacillus aminovorans TaxID=29332 RepID=A0A177KMC5_9BACI|nr:TRAP transporter small permease [Domibacillus aminovorans]OAH54523.1 TRAP transporter [Domibacillus aminovorans]